MAELKLTGIALKRPKMLRKHHKYRQGDEFIRNSDVFLLLYWPLNNDRLNLHTNSYNICVTQQRFSLVSLGYLWSYPPFIIHLVILF